MANTTNTMMNNMDKLNKMKAMAAAKKNAKVVCMEVLVDEVTQEVLESVYPMR